MNTTQPGQTGSITVAVESDSVYFGYNTPIEVRDASMQLVAREQNARSFSLPEGLYQVSAVLEDGQEHTRLVKVRAGETTPVQLGVPTSAPSAGHALEITTTNRVIPTWSPAQPGSADGGYAFALAKSSARQQLNSRFTQKVNAPDDEPDSVEQLPAAALLETNGVRVVRQTRTSWIFECVQPLSAVATATLQIAERRFEISLPTQPDMTALCAVRIDGSPSGAHATAWISPERTVANALQNMIASGNLSTAASMADQATQLLRDKYSDPTGATLAALILRKVGRLAPLEGWMENLARDFQWIPDGKILLATLLVARDGDLDRAQSLALEAAKQRILYTESYSLLLDLLRRWPHEAARGAMSKATAELASWSPYIDWNSSCLSISREN